MKIIAIDAIDIKSFGGLVHLQQLIKKLRKLSFIVNTRPLFSDIGFLFAIKK